MSRYIDADALKRTYESYWRDLTYDQESISKSARLSLIRWVIDQLKQQTTADVVEVMHGKWIPEPNCYYRCSNCKGHMVSIQNKINYSYCPYCGADMRGEENVRISD